MTNNHEKNIWQMNAWFTFKSPVEIRNIIRTFEPNIHDFGFKFQPLIFRGCILFQVHLEVESIWKYDEISAARFDKN